MLGYFSRSKEKSKLKTKLQNGTWIETWFLAFSEKPCESLNKDKAERNALINLFFYFFEYQKILSGFS